MSSQQTLLECRTLIENLGDLQGLIGTGLRHETTDVNILINLSEQSLRSMLAANNYSFMLESTAPANLPLTATVAADDFTQIPWPSDAEGDADEIHAIHVTGLQKGWTQIFPVEWGQRRYFTGRNGGEMVWALKNLPRTQAGAKVAGTIQIFPLPKSGQYTIDYIPAWSFLTSDAAVLVGMPDWHRWRAFDVIVQLLGLRDNDAQGTAQWANNERQRVEERIKAAAPKVRRGSHRMVRAPRGQ